DETLGPARPPLLCKEFILHPIQLDRAIDAGADAVLLIARIVDPDGLARLAEEARARDLEPLVEVATEDELAAVTSLSGGRLMGVTPRDPNPLKMDHPGAAKILARIDPGGVAIPLSGLSSPEDVARVASPSAPRRADAALIGEALMRRDDPTALLSAMVAA